MESVLHHLGIQSFEFVLLLQQLLRAQARLARFKVDDELLDGRDQTRNIQRVDKLLNTKDEPMKTTVR